MLTKQRRHTIIISITMKTKRRGFLKYVGMPLLASILAISLLPSSALAFSGYGSGTPSTPYRIGSCSQLEEMNNNLSGYYVLASNIDCSGVSNFTSIGNGTAFSGTFDGQGHTIKGLTMNDVECGLFAQTSNATIENVNLQGGSMAYNGSCGTGGSIDGDAYQSTLTNVHSSMAINTTITTGVLGGLVGYIDGYTLSDSSFSGTITNNEMQFSDEGGLIGQINDATLSNSYSTGSINESGSDVYVNLGGLIGTTQAGAVVSNVYSSGTINNVSSAINEDDGGLIGYAYLGSVSNAFSASPENNTANAGTIAGDSTSNVTYSGIYYDQTATTLSSCSGAGSASVSCTAENVSGANPSYFFNSNNAPFSNNWNFTTTWQSTSSYPILQNLADFNAPSGVPNNGDANGDGILDSYEANVLDLESNIGWVNISIPSSTNCTLGNGQSIGSVPADPGYTSLTHMLDFNAYCPTAGMTIPVTLIFSRLINTSGADLLFYNPNTSSYSIISGAVFSTVVIGGNTETKVTYNLTDGGPYDLIGTANGLIEDPVFIADPPGAPNTGFGAPTHTNLVATMLLTSSTIVICGGLVARYLLKQNF